MSGQFDKRDFEQNPANLKKKRNKKDWKTNNASDLCSEGVLTEPEIKKIKEENWLESHVPKPSKREIKYSERIYELENASIQAPLSKKEKKELKKLNKKYKKAYKYRHRDLSSSHCCLKSCLAVFTLVLVLGCVAVFSLYYFFAQPYTGITLFETFDLIKGVYTVNEEDVVHQTFDADKEGDAFFAGLQKALYLNTSLTIKDLLALIPQSSGGTGDEGASVADLLDTAGEPGDSSSSESITGNPDFDKLLQDARFDFSSLKDYNGGAPIWEITDKSIAGVLQQAIGEIKNIPMVKELLQSLNLDVDLGDMIAVRQCLITQDANKVNTMEIVIQVKIHNLVSAFVSGVDFQKYDGLVKASLPLVLKAIPNNIYLTAKTTPELDKAPVLGLNSINSEVLQRLLTTLDSKVLNGKIESVFNSVGNTIFSTIKKISELAADGNSAGIIITPSTANSDGKIEINILQALMRTMKIENVSSSDFLLMIKHLNLVTLEHDGDVGKYIDANYADIKDKTSSPEQFEKSKNNLFTAYGIDPTDPDIQNITADTFIDSFTSIQDKIVLNNDKLYDSDYDTIKSNSMLSDAALAQVMNSLIKKQLGNDFDMEIVLLDMQADLMNIVAKIDIVNTVKSMVGGQFGPFESLILSIFPTNMFVEITVPYDKEAEGFKVIFNYKMYYSDDQVKDDEENQAKSEQMFNTLSNLMASFSGEDSQNNFTLESIENKIKDTIYPALDNLNFENADITIQLAADGLQFPTVFEIMAATVNKELDEGEQLEPYEIQDALRGYYKYNGESIGDTIADNLVDTNLTGNNNFVSRELMNKFFMKAYIDSTGSDKALNSVSEEDVFAAVKGIATGVTAENIAKIIDIEKMAKNKNTAKAGNLEITALELAKLISLSGELSQIENIAFYNDFKFTDMNLDVSDTNTVLSLVISAKLNSSASSIGGFDISKFATKYLIINATVDLNTIVGDNDNKAYKTTVAINDATGENIDKLLKIITQMTGSSSSDFNQATVADNIGKAIYSAFKNFADQGIELNPTSKLPNVSVSGFTSTNIYELVGQKTMQDKYAEGDDENIKNIICKLNNPTNYMITENPVIKGDGDSYDTPVDDDNPTSRNIKLIKKTTNAGGNEVINIHDAYIGRQLRKLVSDTYATGFDLVRFAILNDPAKRTSNPIKLGDMGYEIDTDRSDFDRIINGLNIRDLVVTGTKEINGTIYETDIFTDFGNGYDVDKGLMYFNFKVGKDQLVQDDSPMKALLPESVYSGSFLNLNTLADGGVNIMCTYLNNLSKVELDMLTKISSKSITAPIVDAINSVLTKQMTFNLDGYAFNVGIGQILNLTLYSANNDTEYVTHTYSYFEGALSDLGVSMS